MPSIAQHAAELRSSAGVPARTTQQRMDALEHANVVRSWRAQVKRDLKARSRSVVDLLSDPPVELETMKVVDLLQAVPKLGRVKVDQILYAGNISPSKTVGGISRGQRERLMKRLAPYDTGLPDAA